MLGQLIQRIDVYGMVPMQASTVTISRSVNVAQFNRTVSLNPHMRATVSKLLLAFLSVIGVATRLMNQSKFSVCARSIARCIDESLLERFRNKLLGNREVEDILKRVDRLVAEEARMSASCTLNVVHECLLLLRVQMEGMPRLPFPFVFEFTT